MTFALRRPVKLSKKDDPVAELMLKPRGQALRGLQVAMGQDEGRIIEEISVGALARAGLRMAGVGADYLAQTMTQMHARDVMELHRIVRKMLAEPPGEVEEGVERIVRESDDAVIFKLAEPVQFNAKTALISELRLEATGRALQDLSYIISEEGHLRLVRTDVHALALLGVRMASTMGDIAFVDVMHPHDVWGLAMLALSFIEGGSTTGNTP